MKAAIITIILFLIASFLVQTFLPNQTPFIQTLISAGVTGVAVGMMQANKRTRRYVYTEPAQRDGALLWL